MRMTGYSISDAGARLRRFDSSRRRTDFWVGDRLSCMGWSFVALRYPVAKSAYEAASGGMYGMRLKEGKSRADIEIWEGEGEREQAVKRMLVNGCWTHFVSICCFAG